MKKIKVLLVDDEEDNLLLMHRTLRSDYLIEKTVSPLEALEMLETKYFDIIISDHKMPEMDGVEFLSRSCQLSPQSVRLLVTAYSDANILIEAINKSKIFRYIKKPWEPAELMMIMQTAADFSNLKQENDQLIYDLKKLFSGTINAIIEALDAKDSFTLGRSRRVTMLSMLVAKKMNLPPEEIGKLELAGLLHDIGMIGISEEILNKTEALTPYEYEMIKKHVEYSVKILEDIKQLREVIEIIKTHHERYDGSGYPLGLKGEDIPVGAGIIAVADAYDSMVSQRSYRQGLSSKDAIERITAGKGKQFDPIIVDIFLEIIPEAAKDLDEINVS